MSKIQVPQQFDEDRYPGASSTIHFTPSVLKRARLPYLWMEDPMPGISLEGEQMAARDDIVDWILHPSVDDRVLTVGGYGGTGKSVLCRYIQAYLQALGIDHAVTSLTGKAVEVLRRKGVENAQTVHSLMYTVDENEKKRSGQLAFIKNGWIEQDIVLIDEAQILSEQAYLDFLSFPHVRLIAFGDHGQLRSIGNGTKEGLMDNPRVRLEEPRRQALQSNILKFAHAMRQGKLVGYGKCHDVEILPKRDFWRDVADPEYDQIIVGFNKTRNQVNQEVRKYRGYHGDIPNVGERVICLYNHREIGINNGQMFTVCAAEREDDDLVRVTMESDGTIYTVMAVQAQFGQNKLDLMSYNAKFRRLGYYDVVFLDYAYAISGHKAMGSEYAKGKVLEEVHPDWDLRRWAYTSIIRFYDGIQYFR